MQYPAPRVLLADAHADTRELYEIWLAQRQFTVYQAASSDELLRVAHFQRPDVIVVEMMLPGGGADLIGRLRADPRTAEAIVVVLTTQTSASLRDAAVSAGADDYLVKPCGATRLGEVMVSVSRARFDRVAPDPRGSGHAMRRAAQRTFAIRERVHGEDSVPVSANPTAINGPIVQDA